MHNEKSFITSWHSSIRLTFDKYGYEPVTIKTDNVTETVFEVRLHKKS